MAVNEHTQQPPVFVIGDNKKDSLIDYAVKGGLLLLLLWGGKKVYDKLRHNTEENKAGKDPATQQAMSFRSAMNPSGFEWLKNADGTDEDSIFNTAKQINDVEAVIKAYRNLYTGESLMDDLKRDMKPESYTRLLNMFKLGKNTPEPSKNKSSVNYQKGLIIISKAAVNIRKTPRVYGTPTTDKLLIYKRSNVIKTVDTGTAVGITTGRSSFDEKAEPSGVLFVEVQILKTGAAIKDSYTAWVAGSQVETITGEQYKTKRYPALSITKDEYESASSVLSGMAMNADYQKEIITISPANILNEKFKTVGEAAKDIILGYPIMELITKDNVFVKFQTIDETERWVNKKHIKTISK